MYTHPYFFVHNTVRQRAPTYIKMPSPPRLPRADRQQKKHTMQPSCHLVLLLLLFCAAGASAQTHCTEYHQWFDGKSCLACNTRGCNAGMYRETCTTASTQDAHCIPCTLPPPNAVHVTGGLPFLEDACMWACRTGYFRQENECVACNRTACEAPMVRGPCMQGARHDAQCMCPVDHYMAANGLSCLPCKHASCERPEYETLYRCPGHTAEDVSQCMPNVVLMPAEGKIVEGVEEKQEEHNSSDATAAEPPVEFVARTGDQVPP